MKWMKMVEFNQYEYIVFSVEGIQCALPLDVVIRVIPTVYITPLPQAPQAVKGTLNFRGELLPVFEVRCVLQFPPKRLYLDQSLLLCQTKTRRAALLADQVYGVESFVSEDIKESSEILPNLPALDGVIKTQKGLLLIHNINAFLTLDEEQLLDQQLSERGKE